MVLSLEVVSFNRAVLPLAQLANTLLRLSIHLRKMLVLQGFDLIPFWCCCDTPDQHKVQNQPPATTLVLQHDNVPQEAVVKVYANGMYTAVHLTSAQRSAHATCTPCQTSDAKHMHD